MGQNILRRLADASDPVPLQRTEKGLKFDRWYDELRNLLDGKTKEDQEAAVAANQDFIRGLANPRSAPGRMSALEKAVSPTAVHVDSLMSNFSLMYANDAFIGERLMPAVSVSKRSDKYATYPKRERLGYPDDSIGHRASPNELEESRSTANYSVQDYGYKNFLDLETVQNEDAPLNEMLDVVEAINEGIAFRREKRLVTSLTTSGNYSGNTASAGTAWDDSSGGTIIADVLAADAALWKGPTPTMKIGFCGLTVWNTGIANNPKLTARFGDSRESLVTPEFFANLFGLDAVLIGRAREDTANEGQSASYARMWSAKVFGIVHVARRPTVRSAHFGSTFRMSGDPYTTEWTDPGIGKRGGIWSRVSVSEDHKIVAGDAGFLITAAIS